MNSLQIVGYGMAGYAAAGATRVAMAFVGQINMHTARRRPAAEPDADGQSAGRILA